MNKPTILKAIIPDQHAGQRLDQALAALFTEHSRARLQNWIRDGKVRLNQESVSQRFRVKGGEHIEIIAEFQTQHETRAESIPIDIVHEDDEILVINKPVGLVVHPGAGNPEHTLMNALLHHCDKLTYVPRAGIVHRLDKDTSGLMVVAKTPESHTRLVDALQRRDIHRYYLACVRGELIAGGKVDEPIGRHPTRRTKMAVHPNGKAAVTHYRIEQRYRHFTLLRCKLDSGRTHQIRVHMAHIKHPLVGDPLYGGRAALPARCSDAIRDQLKQFKRQALHACELALLHPVSGEPFSWSAPIPDDFASLLKVLEASE